MSKKSTASQKSKQAPRASKKPAKLVPAKQVSAAKGSNIGFYLTIGVLFIVAAGLLGWQPIMRRLHEKQHIATAPAPAPARTPEVEAATKVADKISGKPTRLVVPSLKIDVSVADGTYNAKSKTWTLSNNKAHYALMTPLPNNQEGNTFIYGHNRPEVFSKLSKLNIGETAMVYTDNGHVFTYKYRSAYETNPNDSSLFNYEGAPIMTLQTCSGLWYQNRFLMTFDLVGVV